ncbi:aspartate aminotransferase family protein [Sporosarcina sp. Marseille-Q4063]|uniref:aspartate aminotransferase family protein n=1 Tax=Sporosarcina sp. Marseille-Q4063 TaxID=2810514 RepID=UPI001BB02477|nr:aspartate aminotransferase family protein [Sporosarcina sp. Marseille-Q4063]QUW22851.1 aspartate aminotransferase family protein [Sporosarcina sp. Marseille-Q4063]
MNQSGVLSGMEAYIGKTPKSLEFSKSSKKVMPGGVTANIKFFEPYPTVMAKGSGVYLTDIDGNEYVDYLLSYGALMTGHGHPKVLKAIQEQISEDGTLLFGTPHRLEVKMGQKIQQLYPSMEKIRYTNSGTEATLLSIRLAYAYTGKYKIAKFEGHYHGGFDQVLLSINPPVNVAGPANNPIAIFESKGVDPHHLEHTIILPFNDLEATREILMIEKGEIAAVIIEPIQGGFIPAEKNFMEELRKLTTELGILLIFDEVKTGFRVSLGGAQELYGIKPDITTLGKVVGGGFPFGIVGGTKEVMEISVPSAASDVFDNSQSKGSSAQDVLFHSGTYNGHPTILAAGLATIDLLEDEIQHVFTMTEKLKIGINQLFASKGIDSQTIGLGSIFNIVLTDREQIRNYRDLQQSNFGLRKEIDYHLLSLGVYTKPLNRYSLSTVHGEREIDRTLEAYETTLNRLF